MRALSENPSRHFESARLLFDILDLRFAEYQLIFIFYPSDSSTYLHKNIFYHCDFHIDAFGNHGSSYAIAFCT